ncbi:hypothetical protein KJ682_14735, partial [bacterium]|nr:hypothetical protein [bacterium]
MRYPCRITTLLTVLVAAAFAGAGTAATTDQQAKIFPGVDTYSRPITTSSAEAQRWFDQGFLLLYGFNHDEATRSFQAAAELDPEAAMPWWGVAYAAGMNINDPIMTEDRWRRGHEAAQRALSLLDDETAVEKALVEAVARRYTWPAPAEQRPYDEAYASAMAEVYSRFAADPDVAVLYAESLMDLQPWDYWTPELEPKGKTTDFTAAIESVLGAEPDHPGATHFYIHAMEAGP